MFRFHTDVHSYQSKNILERNERTVRPGVLLGRYLLKEEPTRGLENEVTLESREALVLRCEVVGSTGVEGRSCTGIGGICFEEGLELLRGGIGEIVRCDIVVGLRLRTR